MFDISMTPKTPATTIAIRRRPTAMMVFLRMTV